MIAQFALRLICGMSLMWSLLPRGEITAGFFRIQMLVALGLSALAAVTLEDGSRSANTVAGLCIGAGAFAFVGSVLWTLGRRTAGTVCVFTIAAVSSLALVVSSVEAAGDETLLRWLGPLSELSTAALLGAAVTGMLLGHWYLTAPTMSIAPLSRIDAYLAVAAVVRLGLSAVGLGLAWGQLDDPTHLVWISLRWIAGIAGPIVVALLVWRILRYRNTQSATGVLFVGVILSFIGETTAALLMRELAIPL
jgi:hypothetical protein